MVSNRKRFYAFIILAGLAGYAWLIISLTSQTTQPFKPCIFSHITSVPCPSCGTTTSLISLMGGGLQEAIHLNPLGIPIAMGLLILPLWITFDLIGRRQTLYVSFKRAESVLKRPAVAIAAIALFVANWLWVLFN